MQLADFRDLFVAEAQEYLDSLNQATLRLEKNRQDLEAVHTLFRTAHNLKGMSATMGFEGLTQLCHKFENALDQLRSGNQPLTQPMVDLLFEGIDELSRLIQDVAAGGEGGQPSAVLLERIEQAVRGELSASPPAPPAVETAGLSAQAPLVSPALPPRTQEAGFPALPSSEPWRSQILARLRQGVVVTHLRVGIDSKCAFKGVRALLVLKKLENVAEILQTLPPSEELQKGKFELTFDVWVDSALALEELKHRCQQIVEVASIQAGRLEPLAPMSAEAPPPAAEPRAAMLAVSAAPSPAAFKSSIVRVRAGLLDHIMDRVGELVTSKIRLTQIAKEHQVKDLSDALVQVEHIVNELQAEAMAARMVPMEQTFSRFIRMVRDLARNLGKEVELTLHGGDIELDRGILDEIADPLVHLLRNAVDHGIEAPQIRLQLGKPRAGQLRLEARRENTQVVFMVEDDGGGIPTDKVRAAAVASGLLREEQAKLMSEEEAIQLIVLPGFSTAHQITSVSGRGVGVDAVRSKVERLGGSLRIESQAGKGTRFRIRLPLTLAIIQVLRVKVGCEEYLAPVANVLEAMECSATELRTIHGQEVVLLREELLPVFRLGKLLEVPCYLDTVPQLFSVLVVEDGERRVGVLVDAVLGQTEVAIKGLGRFLKFIRGFGGVSILDDGRIGLILDFATLWEG